MTTPKQARHEAVEAAWKKLTPAEQQKLIEADQSKAA